MYFSQTTAASIYRPALKMEQDDARCGSQTTIDDLPEELLEFILSLIPPYKDLHDCMCVSKKWRKCVLNVVKCRKRNFLKAIHDFNISWDHVLPVGTIPTISKRYSHSAIVHDNFMYVFGGCASAMTAFNDLWMLNLSNRTWKRPLAMGTYPSPKACSSLVLYKNFLVLFGGWTYPPLYPLYQSFHLFNELHVYDIPGSRWTCISTMITPPPMAGHSVSVVGEWMIVFGGLQKPPDAVHCEKSNDIWKLHLENWVWVKQEVQAGPKPIGRFGQTQVILNTENLLILGGSGGPSAQRCDSWILNMKGDCWKWIRIEITGKGNEPGNIWSNPGCKIGDKIVVLNRIRENEECPIIYYPKSHWTPPSIGDGREARIDLAIRRGDRDENVNGRRGYFRNAKREMEDDDDRERLVSIPGPSGSGVGIEVRGAQNGNMAAFGASPNSDDRRNILREKRLGKLQKVEAQYAKRNGGVVAHKREKRTHYLGLYILDISHALDEKPIATWIPPKNIHNGPEETILYTLVEGKSELIMFGGIQKDENPLLSCHLSSQICNSLHFITSPTDII